MHFKVTKKSLRKMIILILFSIFAGCLFSFMVSIKDYVKSKNYIGKREVYNSWITVRDGLKDDNNYIINEDKGKIILEFPKRTYITKLQYEYKIQEPLTDDILVKIYFENIYGEQDVKEITDNYLLYTARSVIPIKENVYKISIEFPETNSEIKVNNFIIDNSFKFNPLIAFFVVGCFLVVLFLIAFREENSRHPEIAVFVSVLVLGALLLMVQPPYCTGWDEHIHFKNSYNLAVIPQDQGTPNVVKYIDDITNSTNEHVYCNSIEERIDLIRIMNQKGMEYGSPVPDNGRGLTSVGYVVSAIFISISRFLKMPFYLVWLLGKFANVLLYAVGMSIAVAIVPIGKRLLSIISLLPTMIFLSGCYTYDITVNIFIILSICIWIKEIVEIDKIFSIKWRIAYLGCMIIGCMPKAVYIPLLLSVFFLPASKFYSTKDKRQFQICVVVCCLLLAATFVLPTLLTPENLGGDPRGGDTSVAGQLNYILSMPIAYLKVLWDSITHNIVSMVAGEWLCCFAYAGTIMYTEPYIALVIGTALTDTYQGKEDKGKFSLKYKIMSLISIICVVALIWTALYLSFTPVGETTINGVQGRYYFPFIFLLYLCLRNRKIKNNIAVKNYQMSIMLIAVALFLYPLFSMFLMRYCL